jgi:hypothetical protein
MNSETVLNVAVRKMDTKRTSYLLWRLFYTIIDDKCMTQKDILREIIKIIKHVDDTETYVDLDMMLKEEDLTM